MPISVSRVWEFPTQSPSFSKCQRHFLWGKPWILLFWPRSLVFFFASNKNYMTVMHSQVIAPSGPKQRTLVKVKTLEQHFCHVSTNLINFVTSSGKGLGKFEFKRFFLHCLKFKGPKTFNQLLTMFLMRAHIFPQWMHVELPFKRKMNLTMMLGVFKVANHLQLMV